MDAENQAQPPKKRGRKPKSQTAINPSSLKKIELDQNLKELIDRKTSSEPLESLRVKLPADTIQEIAVNVASLNASANTQITQDKYVRYALELANDHLKEILRRHLS